MPKVSLLPELNEQLVNGDRAIVVHAGETMQWDPYDYLVKNSGDETIAGAKTFNVSPVIPDADADNEAASYGQVVKNMGDETVAGVKTFSSSPVIPDATSANQAVAKGQLDAVQNLATPISDLSRVMRINGDGVPTFPDNVAGRLYFRNKDWTVTTGWTGGAGSTLSIENSSLKVVTTAGNQSIAYTTSATYQNKLVRLIIKSDTVITNITVVTGSTVFTAMNLTPMGGGRYMADIQWSRTGSDNLSIFPNYPSTAAITWYLESIYIGSGLYDTPVYDKACCNRATNKGVLPVPAPRGLGLAFNGAQYLQFDNPVIGTTGTVRIKFKRGTLATTQYLFTNSTSVINGMNFYISTTNTPHIVISNGTSYVDNVLSAIADVTIIHTLSISSNGSVFYDGSITGLSIPTWYAGLRNLCVGQDGSGTNFFNGNIYDMEFVSEVETIDSHIRYHNGDDAVDSQQKAVTPTPHALMCRDNEGMTYQAYLTKTGSSTGLIGAMCFDASYLYICTAVNTWKRVALTTF